MKIEDMRARRKDTRSRTRNSSSPPHMFGFGFKAENGDYRVRQTSDENSASLFGRSDPFHSDTGFGCSSSNPCSSSPNFGRSFPNRPFASTNTTAAGTEKSFNVDLEDGVDINLGSGVGLSFDDDIVELWKPVKKKTSDSVGENVVPCAKPKEVEKVIENENPSPAATTTEPVPCTHLIAVSRILKGMPQSPHFWPLRGYSELAKNNLISAWDRIFEETTERIQSMKVDGFWVDAKQLWKTLEELQRMGYNVIPLRRRLVELTDVMLNLKKQKSEIMALKNEAAHHGKEKSRLEYEIVELKGKIVREEVSFESVMTKVAMIENEVRKFNDVFTGLAIKMLA